MLVPKSFKYRKSHKPVIKSDSVDYKMVLPLHGVYYLSAVESGRITAVQLEAARRSIRRHVKKGGQIIISIFPDRVTTSKPAEVRMGKGKGSFDKCVFLVNKGTVLFELKSKGLLKKTVKEALRVGGLKLPLKVKVQEYKV